MKTFSVRFYKRLILLVLALMIVIPVILAIFYGTKSARLEKQLAGEGPVSQPPISSGEPAESSERPLDLTAEPIDYQGLYPDLYSGVQIAEQRVRASDTVYLTFDCTPTENTRQILETLSQYGVKATFFVTGSSDENANAILKEIADQGHSVGLKSYSNSYTGIYQSVAAYLDDFNQIYNQVYEATGIKAEIFRFPAGSINSYNSGIYQELIAEMLRRSFIFFDWNVSGEDTTTGGLTAQQIEENVLSGMENKDRGIVMLHDSTGKEAVAEALPGIIQGLKDKGYSLQPLTAAVLPVVFSYNSAP